MRRARRLGGRAERERHRAGRLFVGQSANEKRRFGHCGRENLEGRVGQNGERAPRARHAFGQIVARDVLHHPAAGLECLAAARDRLDSQNMVARRSGLEPARPRKVRSENAADRAPAGRGPEQGTVIHRLEGELLATRLEQPFDFSERGSRARGEHQLLRLIESDASKARKIERMGGVDRSPDAALRAMSHDLERQLLRRRPLDGREDLVRFLGGKGRHRGVPDKRRTRGSLDSATRVSPSRLHAEKGKGLVDRPRSFSCRPLILNFSPRAGRRDVSAGAIRTSGCRGKEAVRDGHASGRAPHNDAAAEIPCPGSRGNADRRRI